MVIADTNGNSGYLETIKNLNYWNANPGISHLNHITSSYKSVVSRQFSKNNMKQVCCDKSYFL